MQTEQLTKENSMSQTKDVDSPKKRIQWENNAEKIALEIGKYYETHKEYPTLTKIAELTGLSYNTVLKHSKSLTVEGLRQHHRFQLNKVISSIGKMAQNGDMAAAKLYLQIVDDYSDKTNQVPNIGDGVLRIEVVVPDQNNKKLDVESVEPN